MSWVVFALGAMFLWSICDFIDKILIKRFVPDRSVALVFGVYPAIFSLILLPFLLYFNPHVVEVQISNVIVLIGAGILEILALVLYLRALQHEDTSTVVPFFQMIPVFSLILGFFLLGETLSTLQIISGLGIVLGSALLSYEVTERSARRFRRSLIVLMLSASFVYALFDAIFKWGASREDFWTGVFWQHIGIVLTGVVLLVARKSFRRRYFRILRTGGFLIFFVNVANEALYAVGMMLSNFALILVPIALVGVINVYYPVFVFIIGLGITFFTPHLLRENISKKNLVLKTVGICVVFISSMFLLLNT